MKRTWRKKIGAVVALLAAVAVLGTGCGADAAGAVESRTRETRALGLLLSREDTFLSELKADIEAEAAAQGYAVRYYNAGNDPETQLRQVHEALAEGVETLLVNLADGEDSEKVADIVGDAGVVLLNRAPGTAILNERMVFVGMDEAGSGALQGHALAEYFWETDHGTDIRYLLFQGMPGQENTDARSGTAVQSLLDDGFCPIAAADYQVCGFSRERARQAMAALLEQGVDTVFGYPGGTILNVYDALYDYHDKITHILTAHEQGAAHAADGYARSTGKVGVCFATSGPGATNLTTGIATAYMDSSPVVFISCNVAQSLIGKDAFQEVDITGITMPITKFTYMVRDVEKLADVVRDSFALARSGRPGPVFIDITRDVTAAECDYEPLPLEQHATTGHLASLYRRAYTSSLKMPEGDLDDVNTLVEMIAQSEKPMLICGGGVGCGDDIVDSANAGADAVACAAVLHYKKETVAELKEDIRAGGVEVRRV